MFYGNNILCIYYFMAFRLITTLGDNIKNVIHDI